MRSISADPTTPLRTMGDCDDDARRRDGDGDATVVPVPVPVLLAANGLGISDMRRWRLLARDGLGDMPLVLMAEAAVPRAKDGDGSSDMRLWRFGDDGEDAPALLLLLLLLLPLLCAGRGRVALPGLLLAPLPL